MSCLSQNIEKNMTASLWITLGKDGRRGWVISSIKDKLSIPTTRKSISASFEEIGNSESGIPCWKRALGNAQIELEVNLVLVTNYLVLFQLNPFVSSSLLKGCKHNQRGEGFGEIWASRGFATTAFFFPPSCPTLPETCPHLARPPIWVTAP